MKRVLRGAAGLLKAATGRDAAPYEVTQSRRDVCRGCERATRSGDPRFATFQGLTTLSRCMECQCFIAAKTMLGSERCPLGKWEAVPSTPEIDSV